jgi:hypothetical protein
MGQICGVAGRGFGHSGVGASQANASLSGEIFAVMESPQSGLHQNRRHVAAIDKMETTRLYCCWNGKPSLFLAIDRGKSR